MSKRNLYIILISIFVCRQALAQDTLFQRLASPFYVAIEASTDTTALRKGDSWGNFSVLKVEKENTGEKANQLKVLMVAYDTGIFSLPHPVFSARGKINYIRVVAPSEAEIKEYAPIKEFEFAPQKTQGWRWILFFAGVIVLGWLLWYLWKKRISENEEVVVSIDDALAMLIQVKERWKMETLNSQQLGDGLVNSLRLCYRVNTKRSTRQLLLAIKKDVGDRLEPTLSSTLDSLDAWRFGKKEASKAEGMSSIDFFESLISRLIPNKKTEQSA